MTILVGYSPSPEGKAAVEFGIEQARAFDDVLVVLNAGIGETPDERGVATSKDIEELKKTLKSSEVSTRSFSSSAAMIPSKSSWRWPRRPPTPA